MNARPPFLTVYCKFAGADRAGAEAVAAAVNLKGGYSFVEEIDGVNDVRAHKPGLWRMYGFDMGPKGIPIITSPGVRASITTLTITDIELLDPIRVTTQQNHGFSGGEIVVLEQVVGDPADTYQRWTGEIDGSGEPVFETRTHFRGRDRGGLNGDAVVAIEAGDGAKRFRLAGVDGTATDGNGNTVFTGYDSGGLVWRDPGWATPPTLDTAFHANIDIRADLIADYVDGGWVIDDDVFPAAYRVTPAPATPRLRRAAGGGA